MADWSYDPDFKYRVKPNYNVLISEFENGYEQRRLKHANKIREYDLTFKTRDNTEMSAAITFFDNKNGAETSFTIELDGETVTVRFVPNTFWWRLIAYQVYDYGFRVREVL